MTSSTPRDALAGTRAPRGRPPSQPPPRHAHPTRDGRREPGRWAAASGYLAALWAGIYGVVALVWTLTGAGYPFGEHDTNELSLLSRLPAYLGAPLFAGILLTTAVVALATAGPHAVRLRRLERLPLLAFGWAVAAALLVVVPDERLLTLAGYAPMLILAAPFGGLPVDYSTVFTWPLLNQVWCLAGGLLLARALLAWQFRAAGACVACGRGEQPAGWAAPAAAARWGRRAAYVAAAIPLPYAVTRFAWLAGVPLGASREFLYCLHSSGAAWAGAGLGAFAVAGAVLTLGLVQRWGEVFPRWLPGLTGRRVPILLAVIPATLVSLIIASASIGMLGSRELDEMFGGDLGNLPALLWPLWAPALGAATLAYYLRRRGRCATCGRPGTGEGENGRTLTAAAS